MGKPLTQGSVIGIIGGGQLARMLAIAAYPLGYKIRIFEPQKDCPAAQITNDHICANYDDTAALIEFASGCDVVTFEFENVPLSAAQLIERREKLFPGSNALELTQDRLIEKNFLSDLKLRTALYAPINSAQDIKDAMDRFGTKSILKTRTLGYDGKGQIVLDNQSDFEKAWAEIGKVPCVLEGFVKFNFETSIIASRGQDGEIAFYPNSQNIHSGGILRQSIVPAVMSAEMIADGRIIARKILESLEYVGVLAVELFATDSGLVVNEIAPRVHNSGHWTIEGCKTSQFANHIRAICGLPLGDTALNVPKIEMHNLIGDEVLAAHELLAQENTHIHLYGKTEVKSGRKMGHYTKLLFE